jgi:outer membrane lipoprotein carrier protein
MTRALGFVAACVLAAAPGSFARANGPGDATDGDAAALAVVRAIQLHYDGVRDLRASFVQTSRVASLGREDTSFGAVSVKRPGRMRWEYERPEERVIAVDGATVRMYSAEERQLQIAPMGAGGLNPTALDFLLGNGDLLSRFEPTLPEAATPADEAVVRLVPREDSAFEWLELRVDASSYELRESVIQDLFGNRTSVAFRELVENSGVDDTAFEIEVPDGTEIIDLR